MRLILLFISVLCVNNIIAQNYWTKSEANEIEKYKSGEREIFPTEFSTFLLDAKELKKELRNAPSEVDALRKNKLFTVLLPNDAGKLIEYKIWEAPVMKEKLAARYPNIKSYKGISTKERGYAVRFSVSGIGLHASIRSPKGTIYIDPVFIRNPKIYQVYNIKNQLVPENYNPTCGYIDEEIERSTKFDEGELQKSIAKLDLRTYDLALGCTGEYGVIAGGTKELVMETFNVAVNRLNQVYEYNVGMRFVMIDETDKLIFLDPLTDPYVNSDVGTDLLGQNNNVVNGIIDFNSYDVGQLFTGFCTDVGGVASGANACSTTKAGGISCVGTSNLSSFAAGTMAHEVGHQFSAGHSWSNCPGNEEQLSSGSAYEPGSGSTIMSYSGACGGANNITPEEDYFSAGSVFQIIDYTRGGPADCGVKTPTDNNEPEIIWPYKDGFYIPRYTPFELDASAIDADGDEMTYAWDQYNLGPTSTLGSPIGNSPSFRSRYPNMITKRTLPRFLALVGSFQEDTEVLPAYARDLNFRFIVRDGNPEVGATVWKEIEFHSADNAGPFFITYPNSNPDDLIVGQEIEVTWDVAKTDLEPVNCQAVNILLSSDNGVTFDKVLVNNTPNDGSEVVRIPNAITKVARIKIEASNNIFFDFTNGFFPILGPSEPTYVYEVSENYFKECLPASATVDIQTSAFLEYNDEVEFSFSESLPDGITGSFTETIISPNGGSTTINFEMTDQTVTGVYNIPVQAISASDTTTRIITLDVEATNFDDLALMTPTNGSTGVAQVPTFTWSKSINADRYIFEISPSPSFGDTNVEYDENVKDDFFTPANALDKNTLYYWRVTPLNDCGEGVSTPIQTFGTVTLSCKELESDDLPLNISQSGADIDTPSKISIFDEGEISAVSVKKVRGLHSRLSNLTFSLISPSGTEAILVMNKCGSAQNFNCGFDDASPLDIGCPFTSTYKPQDPLSVFIGEPIEGDWTLNINDASNGNGGQFQEFRLQLCSNAVLDAPILINNNTLDVATELAANIKTQNLLTEDANNTADELIYTMVTLPQFGNIQIDGALAEIGSQFSQVDINNNKVKYVNLDGSVESDHFNFTVIDGQGGFVDITQFDIGVGTISGTDELYDFVSLSIRPNPSSDKTNISISNTFGAEFKINILNIEGKLMTSLNLKGDQNFELNLNEYSSGIYFINIYGNNFVKNERLVVSK